MSQPDDTATDPVDFDFHGVVGIRLLDAGADEIRRVARQLWLEPAALQREPDVTIRFVPSLDVENVDRIGLEACCTPSAFYLVDPVTRRPTAQVPFDALGSRCTLTARRGLANVPLLAETLNVACLARGYVAVHGSAFRYRDLNVLVTGWEKGGKTETLLAFAGAGAEYIGDEMMLVSADGDRLLGIPIPISVWDWQYEAIRSLAPRRGLRHRVVSATIGALDTLNTRLEKRRDATASSGSMLRKAMPTLRRQRRSWYHPADLFAGRRFDGGSGPDLVLFVGCHDADAITVEACDVVDVARRMISSNDYERMHLERYYRAFLFAFPDRRNPMLDSLNATQAVALAGALTGKPALRIRHPYPVPLDALREAILPHLGDAGSAPR